MRLLTLKDGDFRLTDDLISEEEIPQYAILSHTWQKDEEVTFKDLQRGIAKDKAGYRKIEFCGQQAVQDHYDYFWIDTCCIDRASSAELTEAINSMFSWYQKAKVCYVYLSDVDGSCLESEKSLELAVSGSRWISRGWTLQELIAPTRVVFFSKEWRRLGDKQSLKRILCEKTGIPGAVLEGSPLTLFSREQRMSWAEGRRTERTEDAAYSLLGILGIRISLLYGEGREEALDRVRRAFKEKYSVSLPFAKDAFFNSHADEHKARCLEGTRTALLHDITEWAECTDGKLIFWLNGMAGTGKSTIAHTAAASFARVGQLGASFFFKKGEGERGNATLFFSTIAHDLMMREPGMVPGIRKALEKEPNLSRQILREQFEKLILHPLREAKHTNHTTPLVIVIDALDECEQDEDIQTILQLLTSLTDTGLVRLRVLVTSRPELPIRPSFRAMPSIIHQDLILHDIEKRVIEHDIRIFLQHELRAIQQFRSLPAHWPTKEQVQELVELAVPLFIFAATVSRYVAKGADPKENLNRVLSFQKSQYSQLDRVYLPVLDDILEEQEDAHDRKLWLDNFRHIVGSIVVLYSPLSILALSKLLRSPQQDLEFQLDALHSVLNVPSTSTLPVKLLHLSFRDFLLGTESQARHPFCIDATDVHGKLASHCLELMSAHNGLRQNMCNLPEPGLLRKKIDEKRISDCLPPELQYACRYWVDHLECSQRGIKEGDTTHQFLEKHFPNWLEAMSLLGESDLCIRLVERLKKIVEWFPSRVSSLLEDASHFVSRFGFVLTNAPLQIHSSGLLFAPEASELRKVFVEPTSKPMELLTGRKRCWEALDHQWEPYQPDVYAVAFSPDGQLVASGFEDSTVQISRVISGQCLATLGGGSQPIIEVAFSPDGQLIASSSVVSSSIFPSSSSTSENHEIHIWRIATGQCLFMTCNVLSTVNEAMFSPDSRSFIWVTYEAIHAYDVVTEQCHKVKTFCDTEQSYLRRSSRVILSPDRRFIAVKGKNNQAILEISTGSWNEICCRKALHLASKMIFSSSGRFLAFASGLDSGMLFTFALSPHSDVNDQTSNNSALTSEKDCLIVCVYEIETQQHRRLLHGLHNGRFFNVIFSPNEKLLASANTSSMCVWDTTTGEKRFFIECRIQPETIRFLADGKGIILRCEGFRFKILDTATGSCYNKFDGGALSLTSIDIFSEKFRIVAGYKESIVRIWDTTTRKHSDMQNGKHIIHSMRFSPNFRLLASWSFDRCLQIWEVASGKLCSSMEHRSCIEGAVFSPDEQFIVSITQHDGVRIWTTRTGDCCYELDHLGKVSIVVFSPDGKLFISVSEYQTINLWDVTTGCYLYEVDHPGLVNMVVFSPDGQLFVSASFNKTFRVWETTTGHRRYEIDYSADELEEILHPKYKVIFSPDGRFFLLAIDGRGIQIYETATGHLLHKLDHSDRVLAVKFLLEEQILASTFSNSMVQIWEIKTGKCCNIFTSNNLAKETVFSSDGNLIAIVTEHEDDKDIDIVEVWKVVIGQGVIVPKAEKIDAYKISRYLSNGSLISQVTSALESYCSRLPNQAIAVSASQYQNHLHIKLSKGWIFRENRRHLCLPMQYSNLESRVYKNTVCLWSDLAGMLILRIS